MYEAVFFIHIAATWFMVGLIWFVQIVHYPLMAQVGPGEWCAYEHRHMQRTTWVVGPAMLIELISGVVLLLGSGLDVAWVWINAALLGLIYAMTAFVQVAQHQALCAGHDVGLIARLVKGNWVRTAAWSVRGVFLIVVLLDGILVW